MFKKYKQNINRFKYFYVFLKCMEKNKAHEKKNQKEEKKNKKECDCGKDCDCRKEEVEELTNDLKRMAAEFDNYRKRTEKEMSEFKEIASANLMSDLLPVLDSLEQGIKHDKEFLPIYEQLFSVLKRTGIEKLEVNVSDEFNHDIMDCLMTESTDKLKEGEVVQVLSTGYKLKGKILRTAKVSINKIEKKENKNNQKESEEK